MDDQLKSEAQESSDFFYDGRAMRDPVPGTVARGELIEDETVATGKDAAGDYLTGIPIEIDDALRTRGAERYSIYCAPCHDRKGNGKGVLAERGGVPTASFHDEVKFANYPDGQLFDTITNGVGLMAGYRYPISTTDRWAIVAYVRTLQQEKRARDQALAGN
ncbi:MAG: cytochrome c [bacterium]|nr:cytochrome c [bacterium]